MSSEIIYDRAGTPKRSYRLILPLDPVANRKLGAILKRSFDIVAVAAVLVVLLPLIFMLIFTLWTLQGRPILFKHRRVGRGGKCFSCWKFRTMIYDGDEVLHGHLTKTPEARIEWEVSRKLKNDPRVTPLGQLLRKTSIDELPQLINILKGDMSLVGPRPIVEDEIKHYGENIVHYISVRPGLTGLWQVSGRSDVAYASRVAMDTAYAESMNFAMDLTILLKTVPAVLKSRGSY
jgi:exopolysaccharide production protein ExoY